MWNFVSMFVRLRKKKNGEYREKWYGIYFIGNKRCECVLNKWEGKPPIPPNLTGDFAFEKSRKKALLALDEIISSVKNEDKSRDEFERLKITVAKATLKTKYKTTFKGVSFSELPMLFKNMLEGNCSEKGIKDRLSLLSKFICFMKNKGCLRMDDVSEALFREWFTDLKVSNSSDYNKKFYFSVIKRLWREFCNYSSGYDWLIKQKLNDNSSISREIFTQDEIAKIINTAEKVDKKIKSMVIVACCTGLRLKDICFLKWESINFDRNLITLKTHKTKGNVVLGMWPILREELNSLYNQNSVYVFPEIADIYCRNIKFLKNKLDKILLMAGYTKDQISFKYSNHKNKSSLRGWHSFRGSFVVLALRAGVKIELIQKILGAKLVEVLYQHYIKIDDSFMEESFTNKAPEFARKTQDKDKKVLEEENDISKAIKLLEDTDTSKTEENKRLAIDLLKKFSVRIKKI